MDLHYLKIFYEVAKEKSFTKAGEKLFINQSAVSIQLKKLESELNSILINRESKQIELTYSGEKLFLLAREIFDKVSRAEIEIERIIKNKQAKISVGATHMVGEPLLPKLIKEFLEKYTHIEFEIHVMERERALSELQLGHIDILLMGEYLVTHEGMTTKLIANYPFVVVAREKIEDFSLLEQMTFVGRGDSILQDKCKSLLENTYQINITKKLIVQGSIETVKNLVKEGVGFAILPLHCVSSDIKRGDFQFVLDLSEYQMGYQAVVCSENKNREELKFFLNFISEHEIS